jgi:hypothetical protein
VGRREVLDEVEVLLVCEDSAGVHQEVEADLEIVAEAEAVVVVGHSRVGEEDQGEALAREVVVSEEEDDSMSPPRI